MGRPGYRALPYSIFEKPGQVYSELTERARNSARTGLSPDPTPAIR